MRRLGLFFVLVSSALLTFSQAHGSSATFYYSDGPWMGRVIDAEMKEAIQGAVVLAVWDKVYETPAGGSSYFFDAVEVLTDKDGKFVIPRFGAMNFTPIISYIEGPRFTIFKPGYTAFPGRGNSYFEDYFPNSPLRMSVDDFAEKLKRGAVVEILKLRTKEERLRNIPGGPTHVGSNKLPILYRLINGERESLGLRGDVGR